jgi:hypothetical protein
MRRIFRSGVSRPPSRSKVPTPITEETLASVRSEKSTSCNSSLYSDGNETTVSFPSSVDADCESKNINVHQTDEPSAPHDNALESGLDQLNLTPRPIELSDRDTITDKVRYSTNANETDPTIHLDNVSTSSDSMMPISEPVYPTPSITPTPTPSATIHRKSRTRSVSLSVPRPPSNTVFSSHLQIPNSLGHSGTEHQRDSGSTDETPPLEGNGMDKSAVRRRNSTSDRPRPMTMLEQVKIMNESLMKMVKSRPGVFYSALYRYIHTYIHIFLVLFQVCRCSCMLTISYMGYLSYRNTVMVVSVDGFYLFMIVDG